MLRADGELQCWTNYTISRLPKFSPKELSSTYAQMGASDRSPHILMSDLTLAWACISPKGEERWSGERLSPFNQLSRCCQISQNTVFGKMHTYKNILYTLCTTMMDGKGFIMCRIMKKLLLTHFGQMGKMKSQANSMIYRVPKM